MRKQTIIILFTLLSLTANAQMQRLSPRPDDVVSLNGKWNFQDKYQINVPGEWVMQGFTVNEGETALYSRSLQIPAAWKSQRVKLRFDAVSSHAIVKVNGIKVGEHEGGFVPFEMDITSALKDNNNILEVAVQARTISDYLGCTSQYAVHTVGGMLRKVTMFALPPVNIADLTINTVFDKQYRNASLQIHTATANESESNATVAYRFTLKDAGGKIISQQNSTQQETAPKSTDTKEHTLSLRTPRQWNPEQPYLYDLQIELLQNGKPIQSTKQKVGFRQVTISGNELLVNGRPVKLRGVNRHEVHPLTGRSIAPELNRQDAILFRDANCNYIRTSHYPPSEEFLQAADELGLFVESEAALTWVEHHASPIWRLWNYQDEKFLPLMIQANADNIMAGKNHPSIIIWSLANESRWSPLWEKVNAFVKKTDPGRPTTFHDQCWGDFNNAGSKADIAVYHYPGINGPAAAASSERPVLFGEYAHLSCYNRRELATDPGVRSAYNTPLVTFYDSIYHYKGCLGGAIWSGIDDVFHLPGGQIVGYGPWGPIDGWRRPKPEYAGMKKAYAPVKITGVKDAGDHLEVSIVNRYDFITLKDIKITANGKPLVVNNGILRVPKNALLVFTDPRGFITGEELFGKPQVKETPQRMWDVSWSENNGAIFVKQGPITYTINKINGVIESIRKGTDTLMKQGPVFCVVPMNSDNGGKPNVAGETYQNNIYPLKTYPLYTLFSKEMKVNKEGEDVRISMNVTYIEGRAKQTYLFTTSGELVTTYDVNYRGNDSVPYQYGLLMQLPRKFEQLQWERNGEFTVYDASDIARNKGEALLNAKQLNAVEEHGVMPALPWKDDANELGSNDFRSTKRFIRQATLSDGKGNNMDVISDGKQASRTWLQDECVQWLIADYSNNGSEEYYGTPWTDGKINIRRKSIKGTVTVRMP